MSTETIRLISDGEKGVGEEGETENIIHNHMTFSKNDFLFFKLPSPYWQPYAIFGEFISISRGWMLLFKELDMAKAVPT